MARLLLNLLFVISLLPLQAQGLVLENTATGKTKALKEGGKITLHLDLPASGQAEYSNRQLAGSLELPQYGMLRLMPEWETQEYQFDNGLKKKNETNYQALAGRKPMSIATKDVRSIQYRTKSAQERTEIGGIAVLVGALSTLVVAPLVSIDYSEGTFNGDTYFRWAGYSLGVTGLGVGLMLSGKQRDYPILQPGQTKDKQRWAFKIQ